MPVPLATAVDDGALLASTKAEQARRPGRYLVSSALAGAYVGVAVVLLVSVSAPFAAAASPATKLVGGAVFGVALTLVVFAGAELFTGNAMFLLQGVYARTVRMRELAVVWGLSLVGNLMGSVVFAGLVHGGGTLGAGSPAPSSFVGHLLGGKIAATGPQLLWRAVLCNLLVCLALWMAGRAATDGAKLAVLWWGLLAFVGSGFEHSVANMTLFSLGVFQGSATWLDLGRNLAWTVPGNVIGGGLLVGLVYSWLAGARPALAAVTEPAPTMSPRVPVAASGVDGAV